VRERSIRAQERSIQEAEKLNAQVEELYSQGQYDKTIPLASRALALHEDILGLDHPSTATAIINLAALYQDAGI
jgi:hypothetical protein